MGRCIVVLALASACAGQARVRAPGVDYLDEVRLEGNRAIASDELAPGLALSEVARAGAAIDPYLLTADAERIRIAYVKRGFFGVQVAARVDRLDAHGRVAVFAIVEGPRAMTRVEIAGLPPEVAAGAARALVALDDGAPFDYARYDAARGPLRALVENAGYAHAEIHATVEPAQGVAVARYAIAAGPRCTFGAITFTGNARQALIEAARARLRFAPGDRYAVTALQRSQAEIYEIGRFAAVQLVPDVTGSGSAIDVAIELAEANRYEVHAGGGVGYEPEAIEGRLRAGFSAVPGWQPLLTFASDARVALTVPRGDGQLEPKVRGLISMQRLDLFRPRLRGEIEGGADYQTVEAYTWQGVHARVGLAMPLGSRALQLRVGWLIGWVTFSKLDCALGAPGACDPPPEMPPPGPCDRSVATRARDLGLCADQVVGAYQVSVVADLRDNPIEPRRGAYAILPVTAGTPYAGGRFSYLQVSPELRGYLSYGALVFAARARLGVIAGDVPVTERYYSGGTSAQRGFSERHLTPRASEPGGARTVAIGGAALIETGIEVRRQIATLWSRPIGANVFLDGGDVTERPGQLDPANLYWAVGVGLWSKLFGDLKIRVDVGYRLNRTEGDPLGTGGGLGRFEPHLGVGEAY